MPRLTANNKQDFGALLAGDTLDASNGVLFGSAGGLQPNTNNRTIIIGMGGTGIKTIDYVKGEISRRLNGTWTNYASFLGIDTSGDELKRVKNLTSSEYINLTTSVAGTHGMKSGTRSAAQRRLVPASKLVRDLDTDGAGQRRQCGAFKLHDQEVGKDSGKDAEIVNKINNAKSNMAPLNSALAISKYEVYVVGSLYGGTCSGGFSEMPALIKKALSGSPYRVWGIFYLPDNIDNNQVNNKNKANAYASLKELDYYEAELMRDGYSDTWIVNDPANRTVSLNSGEFYTLPILMSSNNPGAPGALEKSMSVVAEHFINILGQINAISGQPFTLEEHFSNAKDYIQIRPTDYSSRYLELTGDNHDRPRVYAAVGYAKAAAPEKYMRSYTVSEACKHAGLEALSPEDMALLQTHNNNVIKPFRDDKAFLTASAGTEIAKQILNPISQLINNLFAGRIDITDQTKQFEITSTLGATANDLSWGNIKNGGCNQFAFNAENLLARIGDESEREKTSNYIKTCFDSFRNEVVNYVKKEGPLAFWNVYKGNFISENNEYGTGIEAMLSNVAKGKSLMGNAPEGYISPDDANSQFNTADAAIRNGGVLDTLNIILHSGQVSVWENAFNVKYRAIINQKRGAYVFGENGLIKELIINPAGILAEEIQTFGYLLQNLVSIYNGFGKKVETFQEFQNTRDAKNEVNIAALNTSTYNWLKQQADAQVRNINARQLRDNLIDDFFNNIDEWLNYSDEQASKNSKTGRLELVSKERPLAARSKFDEVVSGNSQVVINASIKDMFDRLLNSNGQSYATTAQQIMNNLVSESRPQFYGQVTPKYIVIIYPASLLVDGNGGPQIAEAIETAAENVFSNKPQILSSVDADSISCYQFAAPFEAYKLASLDNWKACYENQLNEVKEISEGISKAVASEMHSLSPSASGTPGDFYSEVIPWDKYPEITYVSGNPRIPDPQTGLVSREGLIFEEIDKTIEKAEKLGILYCQQTGNDFMYKRFWCDGTNRWDRFDIAQLQTDPMTLEVSLPNGFAYEFAAQNGTTLAAKSADVKFPYGGGILGAPSDTKEHAKENCARVLRAHVPMYCEVLKSLEVMSPYYAKIEEYNAECRKRIRPLKMMKLLKALLIHVNDKNSWVLEDLNGGNERILINLAMKDMPGFPGAKYINNGLTAYYIYTKIDGLTEDLLDNYYRHSIEEIEERFNLGQIAELNEGEKLIDMVKNEAAKLLELEANLNPNGDLSKLNPNFAKKMKAIDSFSDDELKAIQKFYAITTLYK